MTRKVKVTFSGKQKLEYAKRMVEGRYSNVRRESRSVCCFTIAPAIVAY